MVNNCILKSLIIKAGGVSQPNGALIEISSVEEQGVIWIQIPDLLDLGEESGSPSIALIRGLFRSAPT